MSSTNRAAIISPETTHVTVVVLYLESYYHAKEQRKFLLRYPVGPLLLHGEKIVYVRLPGAFVKPGEATHLMSATITYPVVTVTSLTRT